MRGPVTRRFYFLYRTLQPTFALYSEINILIKERQLSVCIICSAG